eukprot:m.560005 g.560005  ORF g.560005 m.560005 type:complete len:140 (-) comp57785_c0_seq1:207-626(-)
MPCRLPDKRTLCVVQDTAGQERFRTLTSSYYRGAHGVILVYDVTSRASFQNVVMWLNELEVYSSPSVVKMLVGNKIDKPGRVVSTQEGLQYAENRRMMFIEASAKTKKGVKQAFEEIGQKVRRQFHVPGVPLTNESFLE